MLLVGYISDVWKEKCLVCLNLVKENKPKFKFYLQAETDHISNSAIDSVLKLW